MTVNSFILILTIFARTVQFLVSRYLSCGKKNKIDFNYLINSQVVQETCLVRDLGVYFEPKLVFNDHINIVVNKAYSNLGVSKPFRTTGVLRLLYQAYVRSN